MKTIFLSVAVIGCCWMASTTMAKSCPASPETHRDMLQTVLNLAKENPDVEPVKEVLSSKPEDIKLKKLKDTGVGLVFQVDVEGSTFVMKKLKKERMCDKKEREKFASEAKHLMRVQSLIPQLMPVVYCWSDKYSCMALEDISLFSSLDSNLKSGDVSKTTFTQVAETAARMHKATNAITEPELLQELEPEFQENADTVGRFASGILGMNLDHLKPGPLRDTALRFLTSSQTKSAVKTLVDDAKNKKQALLHGRLVGKSVLIQDEHIRLSEEASLFVGPCAFDVGRLLAQYLSSYYEHMLTEENNDWHRQIMYLMIDAAKDTLESYEAAMGDALQNPQDFISDVAAYGGLELVRRALNSIPEESKALEVLQSGIRLFNARKRIPDSGRLVVIALTLTL